MGVGVIMNLVGYILSLIGAFTLGSWAARAWYAISDRVAARRKRREEERETWRESVTKQTKPPPMTSAIEGVRAKEFAAASDPDLAAYIALAVPKTPSPTAPASAAKVRRATKRNRK